MRSVVHLVLKLCRDRKAATAVEYGLILGVIVIAIMFAIIELGATTTILWGNISTKVQEAH